MKQSTTLDRIQEQMKPGIITHSGFLGNSGRNLGEMLEKDDAAVNRMGLTHKAIAERLRDIYKAACRGLGLPVNIAKGMEARVESARGKLPCPFLHKGLYLKNCVVVKNVESGAETVFSELNIHMIEEHGFYEGEGSPFRLDPVNIARELRIKPQDI